MPTIEIVSINSTGLGINQDDFEVAIIEENKIESHRSLFYNLLIKQEGVIIHIGNPSFRNDKDGFYFAGLLIDWSFEDPDFEAKAKKQPSNEQNDYANQDFNFKFLTKYKTDINTLLQIALTHSQDRKAYFLTDYQFGPNKPKHKSLNKLSSFWIEHDTTGLEWNTLYELNLK